MKLLPVIYFLALIFGQLCRATEFGDEIKFYDFGASDIVRDSTRDRVYCSVPAENIVIAINSKSLKVLAKIFTGSHPAGLSVSPDGKTLYVANNGSTAQGIAVIDLPSLSLSRHIATTGQPSDVAAGNDRIYSLEGGEIRAYEAGSGTLVTGNLPNSVFVYGGLLEISPDGNTLYYYQTGLSPSSWYKLDVTSWPPTVSSEGEYGSNGQDMALSPDGQFITFASGAPYGVQKQKAADPNVVYGEFATGPYPRAVTYSADGSYLFVTHTEGHVDVWNAKTYLQLPEITTEGEPRALECDRTGEVFFAGSESGIRAYHVGPPKAPVTCSIDVQPSPSSKGKVTGGKAYKTGALVTVKAIPNARRIFVKWTENNKAVSFSKTYKFTAKTDRTLVAHFR